MKNYILGILIGIVVILGFGLAYIVFKSRRDKPEETTIIKGDLKNTPWAKAKPGQWAIYSGVGSAFYFEVDKISGNNIEYRVFDEIRWHDCNVDLLEEEKRFISTITQVVVENMITTKYHPCVKVLEDNTEVHVKCECKQYMRKASVPQVEWHCGAIPFDNGVVHSVTLRGGKIEYINMSLRYFGEKPPDRKGGKFRKWMKAAKEWTPEEVKSEK